MADYRQRESLSFEKAARQKKRPKYLTFSVENPILMALFAVSVFTGMILWMGSHIGYESGIIQKSDIGSIALHDYKAPRNYTYDRVDIESTDKIRAQKVADVPPVYTWDSAVQERVVANINSAFDMMRDQFVVYRDREMGKRIPKLLNELGNGQVPSRQTQFVDAIFGPFRGQPEFEPLLSTRALNSEEIAAALNAWTNANRPEFEAKLGAKLTDDLYKWFVENSFSHEIQEDIVRVLSTVLSQKIVASRTSLDISSRITIQWYDSGIRHSKVFAESEKGLISSLEDSKALARSLINERFNGAPAGIKDFLLSYVRDNLSYDENATNRERQQVADKTAELRVIEEFKKGQTIVASGEPIRPEHYELFEKMMQGQAEYDNQTAHWAGISILILMLGILLYPPLEKSGRSTRQRNRDAFYLLTSALVYALGLKASAIVCATFESVYHLPYLLFLMFPFAAGGMLIRLVISRQYAFYFLVIAAAITTLLPDDLSIILPYALISLTAGCVLFDRPKRSSTVLQAGIWLGLIAAVSGVALYLLKGGELSTLNYASVAILGLLSGLLSSGVVIIGLPIAETVFGYATSNKLLELSNLEHPALKTLFMEAPGTYQHSIMVGSLNEAAADAIGANAILARVGGYYHDIGKTKNAQYFAENQRGDNPHNRLKPNMSALILKTHERDGLEIAKKYHLPKDIMDFIISHHGTSRIDFFYQRAKETQPDVREEDYRYPGPKPQTRETGICMVSDMVEAAVRSLPEKSPDRITVLVRKLINHKFADGQFDECDLTLRDLNDIADAVCGILNAFYHHRPEYPDQKREREKLEAEKKAREAAEIEKKNSDNADDNTNTDSKKSETDINTIKALPAPASEKDNNETKKDQTPSKDNIQPNDTPAKTADISQKESKPKNNDSKQKSEKDKNTRIKEDKETKPKRPSTASTKAVHDPLDISPRESEEKNSVQSDGDNNINNNSNNNTKSSESQEDTQDSKTAEQNNGTSSDKATKKNASAPETANEQYNNPDSPPSDKNKEIEEANELLKVSAENDPSVTQQPAAAPADTAPTAAFSDDFSIQIAGRLDVFKKT